MMTLSFPEFKFIKFLRKKKKPAHKKAGVTVKSQEPRKEELIPKRVG